MSFAGPWFALADNTVSNFSPVEPELNRVRTIDYVPLRSYTLNNVHPPDYGLDAPNVVRNLFIAGIACLILSGTAILGFWSGNLVIGPLFGITLIFPLKVAGLFPGITCSFMGLWMIWSSKVGKVQERERLMQQIEWKGDEQVLDIGCGRGLMLIGAAKHLTTGKATGIDKWQAEDLSGNRPEATLENARREGVAERVQVRTADMKDLPFPDNTFDLVVSRAAIHNLYSPDDRAKAIDEISRVLKPGGQALISDIRHGREYVKTFEVHGLKVVRRLESPFVAAFLAILTAGSLRPSTMLLRKGNTRS